VGLSFVVLALAYSARAAFGLVMPVLEQELGWSRSFNSATAATALMMMAILAPLGGRLVDRQGARPVILIGLGALSAGCLLIAATSHPWAFFLAFGGIAAVGFGLVATHVVSTAVEQEVETNQGFAIGVATSGATGGQFLIVPLFALLMASYSWRWGFAALGLAAQGPGGRLRNPPRGRRGAARSRFPELKSCLGLTGNAPRFSRRRRLRKSNPEPWDQYLVDKWPGPSL